MSKRRVLAAILAVASLATHQLRAQDDTGGKADKPKKGQSLEQRIDEIDQRSLILQRLWENKQDDDAAKVKDGAKVTANGKDGFSFKSNDGAFALRIGGYLQVDSRNYVRDRQYRGADTFLIRRARLDLRGTVFQVADFRLVPSFDSGVGGIQEGYLDLKFLQGLAVRGGKFKSPIGLERLQSSADILFVETGLATNLTPNYDTGSGLWGDLLGNRISYNFSLVNGSPDNTTLDADNNKSKEGAGRVFFTPFGNDWNLLKGIGFGVGGSYGHEDGTSAATTFKTVGQLTAFSYGAAVQARGRHIRIDPQAYWYIGAFGVQGEYIRSSQDLINATTIAASKIVRRISLEAWQVQASYVLGGTPSYKSVTPKHNFDPTHGTWGALELAARWNVFVAEGEAFNQGFVAGATTARRINSAGIGFNWHLAKGLKLQNDYDLSDFKGRTTNTFRLTERFLSTRLQVAF